jgi:hypothetical protein
MKKGNRQWAISNWQKPNVQMHYSITRKMKSKTNKSGYVFLTKSEATAREVLALTFTTYSYEFLTKHLHFWLNYLTEDPVPKYYLSGLMKFLKAILPVNLWNRVVA